MDSIVDKFRHLSVLLFATVMSSLYCSSATAALPTMLENDEVDDGDVLGYVSSFTDRALEIAGLILSGASFLIFAVMLIGEAWNQYQSSNPQYSKVAGLAVLVAVTLIITTYLLTQSAQIIA